MKTCLIITGGDYEELPDRIQYDFAIACDRGYEYAKRMKLSPDVIIGDFDSAAEPSEYSGISVVRAPHEKDDTDTMLAIKYALGLKYEHIILLCALGSRFDHTLANIQSAAYVANAGGVCEIVSEKEWMRTITAKDGRIVLPAIKGRSFSLFSITDKCEGLTVSGAYYDCTNATLTNTFPLGQSNEWVEKEATVSIKDGILLAVESAM